MEAAEMAQTLLLIPGFIAGFLAFSEAAWVQRLAQQVIRFFSEDSLYFWPALFVATVLFAIFRAGVEFSQQNYAHKLKVSGAMIPGLHPGAETDRYLTAVHRRIALLPAVVQGLLVIFPWLLRQFLGIEIFLLTGAALLFLAFVIRDIYLILEAELLLWGYEGRLLIR
jgi:preprotein translocase subunit SecY